MRVTSSKVERLARSLHRTAIVLFFAFIIAGLAAVAWVINEYHGDAPLWRYVLAVADVAGFLVAAVIAQVGSALVTTLGRVRASIIDAILEDRFAANEVENDRPETGIAL